MGEGLIGGILGEEDEKPEAEAPESLANADAFAAAVAARLAGNDPGVARETENFLRKHARLLEIQATHLESEHTLRFHFLRGQAREVDIRRLGLRLRVGFQLMLALLTAALVVGFIIMVHDAVGSRSVIIEPIEVSPNIMAQVPSGKILAASLLDVLTNIQASNHSGAERRQLSNGWTSEISIEVPETGISFSQIERLLKTRFGHDQHIEGDLIRTDDGGLELTVRGSGILPRTFSDKNHDLSRLLLHAGEYVYGQSQPGLWTAYLANNNRAEDAIRFAQSAYTTVTDDEKPYVLNYWANAVSTKGARESVIESQRLYQETVRLKPDYYTGYNNMILSQYSLGDEQGAVQTAERMKTIAGGRPGRAPEEMYENYDQIIWDLPTLRSEQLADLKLHNGIGPTGAMNGSESLQIALVDAWMHDPGGAEFRLKTVSIDPDSQPDIAQAAMDRAIIAGEKDDHQEAARQWDLFTKIYKSSAEFSANNAPTICFSAVNYESIGQPAKADAALDAVGDLRFVDCYRFRGDVLDMRGDWAKAQSWYASAVTLAPSIPSGYYSWGMALARHGDLDAAIEKLREAHERSPHWADPLRAWGDVLVRQGKSHEALAKYDDALKYAPNWESLKESRDAAAKQNI